ncbi:hypothetical protein [Ferruginibacter sp. SUN106]|uniref:hypothetical protein n=1 Tax=Ferruginibacter sp. SUN106 TaxID=2978348 RepID=UPI003D36C0C7
MKKLIRSSALIIGLFFIVSKTTAQTTPAVKTITKATSATIKDSTHEAAKNVIKNMIPDPIAAVANQGKEVIRPVDSIIVKLPPVPDQKIPAKQ